ncbi:hypothetical protein [Pedobacter psychrodurus]|uniref:hypothetical protein n=1 Tax=Pedobacter psychrodurus TaxID=2530456 RepID=UPI00292E6D99|nr:hypothetical protein [Pedobacter psychrodurus]
MFGLFGSKNNKKKDFVFEEFKSQIESKGMKIDSVDATGLIYISQGELELKVSLDNVRRNYERDKDESYISDLVQTLLSYSIELPSKWEDAKDGIFISLFPNDHDFQDFLQFKITDEFCKVYVFSVENKLIWITKDDLKKWNITETELDKQANVNADKLLEKTPITFDTIENRKLGLIELEHTTLKAALLFAPAMKEKVKADFGFPFYAVIPVRDFCYIFSETDFEFFSGRIGKVVVDEYKQSGYPITTEVLKFTDEGVEAIGRYPVE